MFAENGEKSPLRSNHQFLTGCLSVAGSSNRCVPLNYLQAFVFSPGSNFWADPQQSKPSPYIHFAAFRAWLFNIILTPIPAPIKNSL